MKTELLLANSFLGRKMKLKQILYKTCSPEKEKKKLLFLPKCHKKGVNSGDGSANKSSCCSCKGQRFIFQHPHRSSSFWHTKML